MSESKANIDGAATKNNESIEVVTAAANGLRRARGSTNNRNTALESDKSSQSCRVDTEDSQEAADGAADVAGALRAIAALESST